MYFDTNTVYQMKLSDFFHLPDSAIVNQYYFFETYDDFCRVFLQVIDLPSKCIIEHVEIDKVYKNRPREYSQCKLDTDESVISLIYSKDTSLSSEQVTNIQFESFFRIFMEYNNQANLIEFVFESEGQLTLQLAFMLEKNIRFVSYDNYVSEVPLLELHTIKNIHHIIHNDHLLWYQKSIMIHRMVLGDDCELKNHSKDRNQKVERWLEDFQKSNWTFHKVEYDVLDNGECDCNFLNIEGWIRKKQVSFSLIIHFLIQTKKVTFAAKAIMIFIAYHSFSSSDNYNKSESVLRNYVRDAHNTTGHTLKELSKLGWLQINDYHHEEHCETLCQTFGYHVYEHHYSLNFEFDMMMCL